MAPFSPRSPMQSVWRQTRSWRATSRATGIWTSPSRTGRTIRSPYCWATATEHSSHRLPTRWGPVPMPSWRRISPATATSTSLSPTGTMVPCRSCWATAMAHSNPRSPTRLGRTQPRSWRVTSQATAASIWPSPTKDKSSQQGPVPCRCYWATATAPSSLRSPIRWARLLMASLPGTSPGTGSSTSRS